MEHLTQVFPLDRPTVVRFHSKLSALSTLLIGIYYM